ncbi:MAG: metal-binding protein [Chloroflexia bacterium]
MPNGPTHDFITVVSAAAIAPLVLNTALPDNNPTNSVVLLGSYLASGLLFSPDLDLRSAPYRRWRMLRFVWLPYQKLVPHRSWISHSFFFGPLLRILYFAIVMSALTFLILAVINALVPIDPTGTFLSTAAQVRAWIETHPWVIAYSAAGFVLGGASHTLADSIWSWIKRKLRFRLRF